MLTIAGSLMTLTFHMGRLLPLQFVASVLCGVFLFASV